MSGCRVHAYGVLLALELARAHSGYRVQLNDPYRKQAPLVERAVAPEEDCLQRLRWAPVSFPTDLLVRTPHPTLARQYDCRPPRGVQQHAVKLVGCSWPDLYAVLSTHPGRKVFIIGDSMSYNFFTALRFRLHGEGRNVSDVQPPPAWMAGVRIAGRDRRRGRRLQCLGPGTNAFVACYMPAGTLDGDTASTALRKLVKAKVLQATDVAIVNAGAWYWETRHAGLEAATAREVVDLARASGSPLVVWRESSATHFPTASGFFEEAMRWAGTCTPPRTAYPPNLQAVARVVETQEAHARVLLLRTWNITNAVPALHVTGVTRRDRDCLHWCNLAGVQEGILQLLALRLHRASLDGQRPLGLKGDDMR